MKGDKKVIEQLNEALYLELGAVNQYWLHYRLLEDWGYTLLAKKERAESIEEMQHADKLVGRIIFLEGHPNLRTVSPLRIGQNVKEVLEADLAGEYGSNFALHGLDPLPALYVLVAAGLLGWLGAGLVTGHFLRQTRPVGR